MESYRFEQREGAVEPVSPSWRNRLGMIVGGAAVIAILMHAFAAPADFPKGETVFTIVPGQSLKSVGTELKSAHYIQSRFVFATVVSLYGSEKSIPPGDYFVTKPESVFTIARRVAFGIHDVDQIKITIPEGDTVSEIGAVLAQKIPGFSLSAYTDYARQYEGYLFPETYFVYPRTLPADIVDEMRLMFDRKTESLFASSSAALHPKKDIVTMASLIESEAHGDDDRAVIGGILWNRIALGMRLQVDATAAYAAGKPESALTKADLSVDSPYNTYLHKGLPPGPISNPGLLALTAAVNPAKTPYLFYLHDRNGTIHYARTYTEHLSNIRKYLK